MITRADIVDMARSQLGVRWQHQARLRGVALDCVGLIGVVALALGIDGAEEWSNDARLKGYGRQPDPDLLRSACEQYLLPIAVADAEPGDILALTFVNDPQHFAIVSNLDPMRVIHAYAQRRKVVENGLPIAGAKITAAYSYRGIA